LERVLSKRFTENEANQILFNTYDMRTSDTYLLVCAFSAMFKMWAIFPTPRNCNRFDRKQTWILFWSNKANSVSEWNQKCLLWNICQNKKKITKNRWYIGYIGCFRNISTTVRILQKKLGGLILFTVWSIAAFIRNSRE